MSKLEKPAAIERLQEVVEASGAVMVARGGLGVETRTGEEYIRARMKIYADALREAEEAQEAEEVAQEEMEELLKERKEHGRLH